DNAITAITLRTTPTQIVKQRANADRLKANGVEVEGNARLMNALTVNAAVGVTGAHFAGNTTLRGNRVPQVPSYNFATGVQYTQFGWTGAAQLRVTGAQFEDDLNVFTLRRANVVDLFGSRSVTRWINPFVAVENLFDEIYDVGRTPVLTTGLPRTVRAGVRIFLP
ncbi:MAG: hypothetical protein DMF88_26950, partial [Acidobacteria bacterium]